MKLFIAKINDEKSVDPILKNMASYSILDPVIIDCTGMDSEIKEYNGSLLGSLRVMFEKDRKFAKLIAVIIEDKMLESAVKAVEEVTGDLNESKENNKCICIPLDYTKGI